MSELRIALIVGFSAITTAFLCFLIVVADLIFDAKEGGPLSRASGVAMKGFLFAFMVYIALGLITFAREFIFS